MTERNEGEEDRKGERGIGKRGRGKRKRMKESIVYTYRSTHGPTFYVYDPAAFKNRRKTARNSRFSFFSAIVTRSIHSSTMIRDSILCYIPSIFFFFSPQNSCRSRVSIAKLRPCLFSHRSPSCRTLKISFPLFLISF